MLHYNVTGDDKIIFDIPKPDEPFIFIESILIKLNATELSEPTLAIKLDGFDLFDEYDYLMMNKIFPMECCDNKFYDETFKDFLKSIYIENKHDYLFVPFRESYLFWSNNIKSLQIIINGVPKNTNVDINIRYKYTDLQKFNVFSYENAHTLDENIENSPNILHVRRKWMIKQIEGSNYNAEKWRWLNRIK